MAPGLEQTSRKEDSLMVLRCGVEIGRQESVGRRRERLLLL
jgi:hypothetical protein